MPIQKRVLEAALNYPPQLYHYTGSAGLLGIVENRCMWATDVYRLNDTQEFLVGVGISGELVEQRLSGATDRDEAEFLGEVKEHLHVVYQHPSGVACFSSEGDLLSQWRAYAPGIDGLCLEFEAGGLAALCATQGFMLAPCFYDEAEMRNMISEMLDEQTALLIADLSRVDPGQRGATMTSRVQLCLLEVAFATSVFKHHSFREEREWRLVSPPLDPGYAEPRFRSTPRGLVPYAEFKMESEQVPFAVRSVTVAPQSEPVQIYQSVKSLLTVQGLEACTVRPSECRYRG